MPCSYSNNNVKSETVKTTNTALGGFKCRELHMQCVLLCINRGIFGVPSAKKAEVEGLVKQLESQNPTPDPTVNLEKHNYNSRLKKNKAGIEGLHLIGRLKAKAARFKQFSFSSGRFRDTRYV
ncbi:hypothetical protein ACLB2K_002460 [Fragaria x ananassa]